VAELRRIPTFSDCTGIELRLLDSLLTEVSVPAGWVLIREDRRADQLVIVMEGRARLCRNGDSLGVAIAGTCVGGHELRTRSMNAVTMIAETPMTLRVAGVREALRIFDIVPRLEESWEWVPEPASVADEMEAFLRGRLDQPDQVYAALMFTDIVRSTGQLSAASDRAWRELHDAFHLIVARQVVRYNGMIVSTFGDGALARFTCSYSAARCTVAIRDELTDLGLEVSSGPHAGEVEVRGSDLSGVTVHLASRLCGAAG